MVRDGLPRWFSASIMPFQSAILEKWRGISCRSYLIIFRLREALWNCRDFYPATAVGALDTARRVCYGGIPAKATAPALIVGNQFISPQTLAIGLPSTHISGTDTHFFHRQVCSLGGENGFADTLVDCEGPKNFTHVSSATRRESMPENIR